jgi:hypothetical protein
LWGWEASAECALVRLACAVAIGPLFLSSGHSHPLTQICGSTHALPPSALPHYNHLADSNDDTGGSLIVNEQYSSTILNQLHTASSILLDDRCSVLLFDLHAPSLRRAVLSIFSRCVRSADVARLAVAAAGSCDALAHQHSAALQHDSRTDRGVFLSRREARCALSLAH